MSEIRNTLTAVIAALLISACGQTDVAQTNQPVSSTATPPQPSEPVPPPFDGVVTLSARLDGGTTPAVVGVTNLPDGTILMVTLSRKESSYSAQDKTTVSGGLIHAGPFSQKGSGLNPGKYTIDIGSPLTALQPSSVQSAFGDKGSNLKGALTGPSFGGGKVVEYSTEVVLGGESDNSLDAAARDKAKQDLHQWYVESCDDRCRIVKAVAVKQGEQFNQDQCYQQCLAEIPSR